MRWIIYIPLIPSMDVTLFAPANRITMVEVIITAKLYNYIERSLIGNCPQSFCVGTHTHITHHTHIHHTHTYIHTHITRTYTSHIHYIYCITVDIHPSIDKSISHGVHGNAFRLLIWAILVTILITLFSRNR